MPVLTGGGISADGEAPPLPPEEQRRWQLYSKLHALGGDSVPALARALHDPDLSLRRNVTLALGFLAEGSSHFASGPTKIDIRAALPALIVALKDRDELVRAWAAEDIADIGPDAASAVPALIKLLSRDEGSRGSACVALRGIGPAAKSALPALKQLLLDPDDHVRKMASWAVEAIQGNTFSPG
jgi:HEAT repeat protein